jgi:hypothetical protein
LGDFKGDRKGQQIADFVNPSPSYRPMCPMSGLQYEGYGHPDGHLFEAGGTGARRRLLLIPRVVVPSALGASW